MLCALKIHEILQEVDRILRSSYQIKFEFGLHDLVFLLPGFIARLGPKDVLLGPFRIEPRL